jgi:DNA-binding GntR family transcriptional regulator
VSVDYDSPIPPYQQVAGIIRERIESGELAPGQRVPSVTTLMQAYGIARNTARHALDVLRDEGLIVVRPGWGSFVKPD